MTVENPIPGFDIEKFIRDLSWSEDTDDYSKTLVAGNLRNLFASIGQHVSTTMSTAEPVSAARDALEAIDAEYQIEGQCKDLLDAALAALSTAEPVSEQTPPCGFPYCDCSMGAAERCERPAALSHVQAPGDEDALGYATRLVKIMAEKHYPDGSPDWKPLPDVVGILTQIDNMVSGMVRAPQIDEAMVERAMEAYAKNYRPMDWASTMRAALQAAIGGGKP
jgi:hypothetical protein